MRAAVSPLPVSRTSFAPHSLRASERLTHAPKLPNEPTLDALRAALAGRYAVEREIAAGGMATVYLVHDQKHDRKVALKLMKSRGTSSETQRFLREINVTARLAHPHILPLLDSGEACDLPFYVMPFVDGETLRDRIAREGRLPVDQAFHLAAEVADALEYAHAQGIVHRDIKPANILLSGRHAIVADFGVAKAFAQPATPDDRTQAGIAVGTVAYMSPEQATGEEIDGRSDVFSLGIVLFEMLCGENVFAGKTVQEQLARRFSGIIPSASARRREIPEVVDTLLARALAPDPAKRFRSAGEFEGALLSSVRGGAPDFETGAIHVSREPDAIPSIAVLPLVNRSRDPDDSYLSDGIAEEILIQLALRRTVRVCARVSSFALRDRQDDVRAIGSKLGVGHLLLGSLQRAGDRLRVSVQLVDTQSGFEIWSERYDREIADVFALQDEIGRAIAATLNTTLLAKVTGPVPPRPPRIDVYEALLRGRFLWNRRTAGDTARAIASYRQALALDPDYAPAHVGIAEALVTQAVYGATDPREALPEARRSAEVALALDPSLAEGRAVLAQVAAVYDWNWGESEALFRKAIALNPQLPSSHQGLAMLALTPLGRHDEALEAMQRALVLDPLSAVLRASLSAVHLYADRLAQARDAALSALELDPGFAPASYFLAQAFLALGDTGEALGHAERSVELSGRSGETLALLGHVLATRGDAARARETLAELERRAQVTWTPPSYRALVHVGLGETSQALELLELAAGMRAADLAWLAVRPGWAPLRGDARFAALLGQLSLVGSG